MTYYIDTYRNSVNFLLKFLTPVNKIYIFPVTAFDIPKFEIPNNDLILIEIQL